MKAIAIKDRSEFMGILKSFGFKKENITDYIHNSGCYANIIDQGNFCEVWLTGGRSKQSAYFPGGWVYGTDSLRAELKRVIK